MLESGTACSDGIANDFKNMLKITSRKKVSKKLSTKKL